MSILLLIICSQKGTLLAYCYMAIIFVLVRALTRRAAEQPGILDGWTVLVGKIHYAFGICLCGYVTERTL
jgi:hypothetical protein